VREVLAWADQPVEWWPLDPADNPELAAVLLAAGCDPDHFGYWWKWFPERVRPAAPEWVLDGDMVIVGAPSWFSAWKSGQDPLRMTQESGLDPLPVTQDDGSKHYGEYAAHVDWTSRLYSGLVSLPPNLRYMEECLAVLRRQPLLARHNGRENMSEQGVMAAAFGRLGALPIPLREFPFATACERSPRKRSWLSVALRKISYAHALKKLRKYANRARQRLSLGTFPSNTSLDHGASGPRQRPWGYHFARAFVSRNPEFERLVSEGAIYWQDDDPSPQKRFAWMRNRGQWGREGWSMDPTCVDRVASLAENCGGKPVLEIGTSRGYLAAVMAAHGCKVTTVDREDRGARKNLEGLGVDVVTSDASAFLSASQTKYSLIVVDLHGNDVATWRELWPKLKPRLDRFGKMVLYNSHLWKIPEWHDQTGLMWVAQNALDGMAQQVFEEPSPGMIICGYD
jgi:hypothetical protein